MALATKNGNLIIRNARLTEDCKCCKGKEACGAIGSSGGTGTTVDRYDVPSRQLTIQLNYNAYSIPDQFIVRADGQTYIDTGSVSGSGSPKFCKPEGVEEIEVTVNGPEGTAWTYNISCPPDDEKPKDVINFSISARCPPANSQFPGSAFPFAQVCFDYQSSDGGCSPPEIKYEFVLCIYDERDECVEGGRTWFVSDSGGAYSIEPAYPVSPDEIALFGHSDAGRPCMWIWLPSLLIEKAGVRIYAINTGTGVRSEGVTAAFIKPKEFICGFYEALAGVPVTSTPITPQNVGGGLFNYSGTLSGWPSPQNCPRKVGSVLAIPASQYAANPTWNAGWTVAARGVTITTGNEQIAWSYNGAALPNGDHIVFATDNPCDTSLPQPVPLVFARGFIQ